MRCPLIVATLLIVAASGFGCSEIFGRVVSWQPQGDENDGITYYVGGAGPIGNVGSFDVPGGLRDADYGGRVHVFTWQSWTHAGDQIDLKRNREKAAELAHHIRRYVRRKPDRDVNLISLSAGAGIATFALEYLPEDIGINNAFFLGCSLSSKYDLTRALKRIKGKLYVIYSPEDAMLRNVVWYTGTVDRSSARGGIAGLEGFFLPTSPRPDARAQYQKVQNVPWRMEFEQAGYSGGHTGATSRSFVRRFLAPALIGDDRRLVGKHPERRYGTIAALDPASQPGAHDSESAHQGR